MISVGSGTIAGGVGLKAISYCPSRVVTYTPIKRNNTSPFRNMVPTEPVKVRQKPGPKPKPKVEKPKAPKKPRVKGVRSRTHTPHAEQERIVEARKYLQTPKECLFCGDEFTSREGERIDGYRRRETCNRTCAAKRARLRREGKLDD